MDLNVISCRMEWSIPGSSYQAHTSYNEFHHEATIVAFRPQRVNVMIELHQLLPLICMHTSAHTSMHASAHTSMYTHTCADTVNIYPLYLFGVISFLGFGLVVGSSRILA